MPSGPNARLLLQILTVAAVSFVVGYGVMALLVFRDPAAAEIVTVPDLRELQLDAARETADEDGLEVEIGDSLPHPTIPPGAVLAQTPLPGQEVAPGSAVTVLVSLGRERRPVPDLAGLRGEGAERVLRAAGFEVTVEEEESPLPAGHVLAVDPPAGSRVALPARVVLRLSSGPPLQEVPDVIGASEGAALDTLLMLGFEAAIDYSFYWRRPPGEVVGQSPPAGDSLAAGDTVRLDVSTNRLRDFRPRQ